LLDDACRRLTVSIFPKEKCFRRGGLGRSRRGSEDAHLPKSDSNHALAWFVMLVPLAAKILSSTSSRKDTLLLPKAHHQTLSFLIIKDVRVGTRIVPRERSSVANQIHRGPIGESGGDDRPSANVSGPRSEHGPLLFEPESGGERV